MQPSPSAIEREFEALRDIRRRSSAQGGPGTLILDPDLPAEPPSSTPPLSPQAWAVTATDPKTSPIQSHEDDSGSSESGTTLADDPYHLFWLPAHLHPEIAPREFRAFLKEHAHEGTAAQSPVSLARSSSAASTSSALGRKTSMLSKQYRPRENDGVENEHVLPSLRRNKSIYQNDGPQLTINDLQKLEELADEDPSKLSRVIRRSLSLNVAPSFLDQLDDVPDSADDADAPIIVPRPNQILRRAARTKIRKPGLPGDGNGHRFPASRRKPSARAGALDSVGDKGENDSEGPPLPSQSSKSDESMDDTRRLTYTEESSIYDAYADSIDEKETSYSSDASHSQAPYDSPISPTPTAVHSPEIIPPLIAEPEPEPFMQPQPQPALHQPQPQRHLTPVIQQHLTQSPSRTPSPDGSAASHHEDARRQGSPSTEYLPYHSPSPAVTEKRKGKDKKGLLGKFGVTDKNSKKAAKEAKEKEKEKESGFFGSLFGGKKKQEEPAATNIGGGAGPATAAALLGASKSSKSYQPPVSPVLLGGSPYARYPIHVERAVYRLSHIKLANPRRPLYEQVLISNLMFWYLGVINKAQQGQAQNQQNQQQAQADGQSEGQDSDAAKVAEEERLERERKEQEEREARERAERERDSMERYEPRREARRGSLTKAPAPGTANRRAETPVKGPQYGLQHQVMEQEYGHGPPSLGSSSSPMTRTSSAPPTSNHSSGYPQRPPLSSQSRQQASSAATTYAHVDENGDFYYEQASPSNNRIPNGPTRRSTSPSLPPGAMAPMSSSAEHLWMSPASNSETDHHSARSSSTSPPRSNSINSYDADASHSHQPRPRPARSPPPVNQAPTRNGVDWEGTGGGGKPSRSLSANAIAPAHSGQSRHHGNALKKKAPSAMGAPARRPRTADGEEEDVPLAVWQQRRK